MSWSEIGGSEMSLAQVAFDGVQLALAVIKIKKGATDGGVTLTQEECARVLQAMVLLKEGNG